MHTQTHTCTQTHVHTHTDTYRRTHRHARAHLHTDAHTHLLRADEGSPGGAELEHHCQPSLLNLHHHKGIKKVETRRKCTANKEANIWQTR